MWIFISFGQRSGHVSMLHTAKGNRTPKIKVIDFFFFSSFLLHSSLHLSLSFYRGESFRFLLSSLLAFCLSLQTLAAISAEFTYPPQFLNFVVLLSFISFYKAPIWNPKGERERKRVLLCPLVFLLLLSSFISKASLFRNLLFDCFDHGEIWFKGFVQLCSRFFRRSVLSSNDVSLFLFMILLLSLFWIRFCVLLGSFKHIKGGDLC